MALSWKIDNGIMAMAHAHILFNVKSSNRQGTAREETGLGALGDVKDV